MTIQIEACDARDEAAQYGEIVGSGDARADGGWDFLVETDNGDLVVSVMHDDAGAIFSAAM